MLIKSADDKTKRITLLEQLQLSPRLSLEQKRWAKDELFRTKRGIEGERDAAHYLDSYYKDSENFAVIHDLRLEVDGEVAQIDHLLVGRALVFYLLETKNFGGNVIINEHGEFSVQYSGEKCFGIPSPVEQSRRHERILAKLLERLGITGRMGTSPIFHHAVLVHPRANITRLSTDTDAAKRVIKADQFRAWHERQVDKEMGLSQTLNALVNLRGSNVTREWAQQIVAHHKPSDPLQLPDFMQPRRAATPAAATSAADKPAPASKHDSGVADPRARKLVCCTCGSKISFPEGKFCWNQAERFGGLQYCRAHQSDFA